MPSMSTIHEHVHVIAADRSRGARYRVSNGCESGIGESTGAQTCTCSWYMLVLGR